MRGQQQTSNARFAKTNASKGFPGAQQGQQPAQPVAAVAQTPAAPKTVDQALNDLSTTLKVDPGKLKAALLNAGLLPGFKE